MKTRLADLLYWLRTNLWFVPGIMTVAAGFAAHWSLRLDQAILGHDALRHQLYGGDASGARTLLVAVAGSMITVAGVVFSITIVTLSLASQQFGPRLLRNFMRDLGNQVVLGVFIASFVFCMAIIRAIPEEEATTVPSFSVAAGLLLGIMGLGFLIFFIHHVSDSIQVDTVLATIADEAERSAAVLYPHHPAATWRRSVNARRARRHRRRALAAAAPHAERTIAGAPRLPQEGSVPVFARRTGYIQGIDLGGILDLATALDAVVEIQVRPGDFISPGLPLASIRSRFTTGTEELLDWARFFIVGTHRTPTQDLGFDINLLVEIAVRALSPAINDPFTALMCVDRLGEVLGHLARRPFPGPALVDPQGVERVHARIFSFAEFAAQSLDLLRRFAAAHPILVAHVLHMLGDVAQLAIRPEDLAALDRHAALHRDAFRGEPPHDLGLVEEAWRRFDGIRRERAERLATAPV